MSQNGTARPAASPPYRAAVTPLAPVAPPPATPPATFPSMDTWTNPATLDFAAPGFGFGAAPALRVVPSVADQPQVQSGGELYMPQKPAGVVIGYLS